MKMFLVFLGLLLTSLFAHAQDVPVQDFLSQLFAAIKGFGGLSWGMKVGAVIALLISSMKVSLLRGWTWDKVPEGFKPLVAPMLALIAGLVSIGKMDIPSLTAWVMAGGGALLLDNLLSGVKAMPGIGPKYLAAIEFISKLLKKPVA